MLPQIYRSIKIMPRVHAYHHQMIVGCFQRATQSCIKAVQSPPTSTWQRISTAARINARGGVYNAVRYSCKMTGSPEEDLYRLPLHMSFALDLAARSLPLTVPPEAKFLKRLPLVVFGCGLETNDNFRTLSRTDKMWFTLLQYGIVGLPEMLAIQAKDYCEAHDLPYLTRIAWGVAIGAAAFAEPLRAALVWSFMGFSMLHIPAFVSLQAGLGIISAIRKKSTDFRDHAYLMTSIIKSADSHLELLKSQATSSDLPVTCQEEPNCVNSSPPSSN